MHIPYSTELACAALRLRQVGTPHDGDPTHCAMCRRAIVKGTMSAAFDPPKSFANYSQISPTGVICGYCNVMKDQHILRAVQRVVITAEGVYPISLDANRAWFWLHPPKPPFCVVINHNQNAAFHYVWQTPVSMSQDCFTAMVDGRLVQINRLALLRAIDDSRRLTELLNAHPTAQGGKGKAMWVHPWRSPSRDGTHADHGRLVTQVNRLLALKPDIAPLVQRLRNLDEGVLLAMASIVKKTPVDPVCPVLVTSIPKKEKKPS